MRVDEIKNRQKELAQKIAQDAKDGKQYPILYGAYGDIRYCDAIIQETTMPATGGVFLKMFGCEYLWKGFPDKDVVEGIGLAKAMISVLPRKILGKSMVFLPSTLALYFLSRKRFYHYLLIYTNTIFLHTVKKLQYDRTKFGKVPTELRRALDTAISSLLLEIDEDPNQVLVRDLDAREMNKASKRELCQAIANLAEFVYLFIEMDCAYRFRFQDVIALLDKERVRKNVAWEVNRLFKVLIERDVCQAHKWRDLRRVVVPFLMVNKDFRKITKRFLLALNVDELRMDESDWYFSLRRVNYKFKGMEILPRLKEAAEMDYAKKNCWPVLEIGYAP